jgi:hypothetical protein
MRGADGVARPHWDMAFGQSVGPSASGRQVKDLLELLENAGHADFRDARGPMGFTQRQAGGKFTADEAAAFIDQLQTAEYEAEQAVTPPPKPEATPKPKATAKNTAAADPGPMSDAERAIRTASTKSLVLEVRRRGWTVTKPK